MPAESNPYYIAPPDIYSALMAGQQGYKFADEQATKAKNDALYKQAANELQKGGISNDALSRLVGIGHDSAATIGALGTIARARAAADPNGVYGNPIMLQKPDGTYAIGAIAKDGSGKIINFGDGLSATVPTKSVDLGTSTQVIPARTPGGTAPSAPMVPGAAPPPGQTSGNFPKDVAGNRYEGERGKDIANAEEAYTSLKTKLPGLQAVVTQLNGLADKATYTQAGQVYDAARRQLNLTPRDAAVARKQYTSMVDNQILPLLRDTFGAQFTEREGNTLRATLGDPDTSPQEKKAVLNSFIEQKVRDVEALRQQSLATSRRTPGYTQPSSGLSAPANLTPQGFANWARANKLQPGTPVTLSDGSTVYTP